MEDVQKNADTCAASIKVGRLSISGYIMFFIRVGKLAQATVARYNEVHIVCSQDYELQLASYSSGLETLLNIPIKRTVLKSPASVVRHEV